jgi:hypothetical protein
MTMLQKKAKVLAYVTKYFDRLDPSGYNSKKFKDLIEPMSAEEFTLYANRLKKGEIQLRLIMPNMKSRMDMPTFLAVAKELDVPLFHRIRMTDPVSGVEFVTPEKYPILLLPIRRAQQTIEKKRSVARDDRYIDAMTGQRAGDDVAAALSHPEIQVLHTRGLTNVLKELVQVRGGNIQNYGDYRTQLEDTGSAALEQLDPTSRTRTSVMVNVLFAGMHIKSTI